MCIRDSLSTETNTALTLTFAQANVAANAAKLSGDNTIVVSDTFTSAQAVTAVAIGKVDKINATNDLITMTAADLATVIGNAGQAAKIDASDTVSVTATTAANTFNVSDFAATIKLVYSASTQAGSATFTNVGNANALDATDTFTMGGSIDVITGWSNTDVIDLSAFGLVGQSPTTQFTTNGSRVANGEFELVKGKYDGGVFTAGNAGTDVDLLVVWDGNTTAGITQVGVVLVGTAQVPAALTIGGTLII